MKKPSLFLANLYTGSLFGRDFKDKKDRKKSKPNLNAFVSDTLTKGIMSIGCIIYRAIDLLGQEAGFLKPLHWVAQYLLAAILIPVTIILSVVLRVALLPISELLINPIVSLVATVLNKGIPETAYGQSGGIFTHNSAVVFVYRQTIGHEPVVEKKEVTAEKAAFLPERQLKELSRLSKNAERDGAVALPSAGAHPKQVKAPPVPPRPTSEEIKKAEFGQSTGRPHNSNSGF